LRVLKQELKHIIRKLTDWKDIVFADPILPFGTIVNIVHIAHICKITKANPPAKFCKRVPQSLIQNKF